MKTTGSFVPFHTYILKIASRCNLNCDYCFVYNRADQSWKNQPRFMSLETLQNVCERIIEHCKSNKKEEVSIIFHGGEPMLVGARRLEEYILLIKSFLEPASIDFKIGMQSNGLLFDEKIGDVLLKYEVPIGISIDGPPEYNDRHRVNHSGKGSGKELETRLRLLTSTKYKRVFGGFLVVIDPNNDPVRILDYLTQFEPEGVDFILPYDNHDRYPHGKTSFNDTRYGDWLIKLFNYWYENDIPVAIRDFKSIIRMLFNGLTLVESLGLGPVDLVVIETNGDIEAVDSLKASFDGAAALGFNVCDTNFDDAASHLFIKARNLGSDSLCKECRECPVVDICGGGYLPNRYSQSNGFDNPSIFCADLEKLIRHINSSVTATIKGYHNNEQYDEQSLCF